MNIVFRLLEHFSAELSGPFQVASVCSKLFKYIVT